MSYDIAVNISIFQLIVYFLARLCSEVSHCFLSDRLKYPINHKCGENHYQFPCRFCSSHEFTGKDINPLTRETGITYLSEMLKHGCSVQFQKLPMPKQESSKKARLKQGRRKVPFAKGYRPPSQKEQLSAIGFKSNVLPVEYSDVESEEKFFLPIPEPKSVDDWLAQYAEDGQSFREYLEENPWFSKRKSKFMKQAFRSNGNTLCEKYPEGKIYVAKIGDFSDDDISFDSLIDYVRRFLGVPVQVLEELAIEKRNNDLIFVDKPAYSSSCRAEARIRKSCLKTRFNAKSKHIQIEVDSILAKIRSKIPSDALCLIGLTPYDLYGDDSDLFVAGMAAGNRRVAVFSLMRYNPALTFSVEHWYDIKESKTVSSTEKQRLILQRSCKLVVHEICHLLGLAHCVYFRCSMNGSGHLQEDFDQPMMLCPVDLHKLQKLVGFDVIERYQSLLEFYNTHNFTEEAAWTERRLQFLQTKKSATSCAE